PPELLRIPGVFNQFRGAPGQVAAGQGLVPEHITHALAELLAQFGNAFIRGATKRAGVTAVFNQGNGRVRRAQYVIAVYVNRTVKIVDYARLCHSKIPVGVVSMGMCAAGERQVQLNRKFRARGRVASESDNTEA